MRLANSAVKVRAFLDRAEEGVAGVLLAACLGIVFLEMTARGAFHASFMWSDELSRYLFIWMTYLGASALVRENGHIRVELLINLLPKTSRRIVELFIVALCLAFTSVVFVAGLQYANESRMLGMVSADTNLAAPIWVFQAAIPVGYFLISVRLVGRGVELLRGHLGRHSETWME